MAEDQAPARITIKIDGQKYEVPDPLDLTFNEASLIKRLSGAATPDAILHGMANMDAEVFPAMVLVGVQRINPKFTLEDVGKITWREMTSTIEREPRNPPTVEARSEPPETLPTGDAPG